MIMKENGIYAILFHIFFNFVGESVAQDYNLEQCFHLSCTIPGTRKLHSFVPILNNKVRVSYYSAADTFREERGKLL